MFIPASAGPRTLVDVLNERAQQDANRVAFYFYEDEALGGGETQVTYGELHSRACAIALALEQLGPVGVRRGAGEVPQRAIVLLPPGFDYIAAYFGVLYAGWIPVPTFPPDGPAPSKTLLRLRSILADAAPRAILTTSALNARLGEWLGLGALGEGRPGGVGADAPRVSVDSLERAGDAASAWRRPPIQGTDLALLQYTSGSVGEPKGTMVSHSNLLANLEWIASREDIASPAGPAVDSQGAALSGVCWLPPYHDMGLIGGILNPVHAGYPMALMPPFRFLKRPARWLQAISDHRAQITVAPNFAFEFAAGRVKEREKEQLDLSCLTTVFNGAEPIRASALDAFVRAFAPQGFRSEAFLPCYGLAEGTLIVSGNRPGQSPRRSEVSREGLLDGVVKRPSVAADAQTLVGCGPALGAAVAVIVDPVTQEMLPSGRVGEIWVQSRSVAQGYWGRPEETATTFGALLADGRGPFLRTGDTGFFADGELFVVGRLKDLIIVDGQNLYPADVEETVEGVAFEGAGGARVHPIGSGGAAAVSVATTAGERPLILAEIERRALADLDVDRLARTIRQRVTRMHRVETAGVVLLRRPGLPRTPNGKLQRSAARTAFLSGRLAPIGAVFFRELIGRGRHSPASHAAAAHATDGGGH